MKIRSFTDLDGWKHGHQLVLSIYQATLSFPSQEKYGLVDQIRRASVSITSNLAEGFSRYSSNEKKQFYYIALGSLTEVQNQLLIAKDLKYISLDSFKDMANKTVIVSKLINGLIKAIS